MVSGVHIESLAVAGYAALLVLIAESLELVARFALRRADQYHTAGFTYHRGLDVWECPQGERLRRQATDHTWRVVRYRAPAHACNRCSVKPLCTDSDSGRELEHRPESWLESEIGRFHRGISLSLLFLAWLILALEMARHGQPQDLLLLGGLLVPITLLGMRQVSAFWSRPADARERS
ncbi:MAG TPA: transposase [bacterium]|nr:transposase [bacterium]